MENLDVKIKSIIELMGFADFSVNYDSDNKRFSVFINDDILSDRNLPMFVEDFDHLIKLVAQKNGLIGVFVDVNSYRKKRENLIVEIAKAAARKAVAEKIEMPLPSMNAYERRLVHTELASNPDIKTESIGEGKGRYIIIRPIS